MAVLRLNSDIWSWDPIAVNPKTGRIYLASQDANQIFVIQGPPLPAEFVLHGLAVDPDRVYVGEPFTVTINITNIGDLPGSYTVILKLNDVEENREEIFLDAYQSTTVRFELKKNVGGTYSVEVGELSQNVEVTQFVVSDLTVNPAEVGTGQISLVAVDITNIGESSGSHALIFRIDGVEEKREEVELAGGESRKVEFSVVRDVKGEYLVDINGLTGVLVVRIPAQFVISDLSITPSEVGQGEEFTVTVNVANIGELTGSYSVDLEIEGEVVDTRTVELNGGSSTIVTFKASKAEPGTFEVSVGEQKGTLIVQAVTPPYLMYGAIGVILVIVIGAFVAMRRRR